MTMNSETVSAPTFGELVLVNAPRLSTAEAAAYLGVSPNALRNWRQKSVGPPFEKISSRCFRYRFVNLERWLAEHNDETGAD